MELGTIKFILYSTVIGTIIAVIFNLINILLQIESNKKIKILEKRFDLDVIRYNKINELLKFLNSYNVLTFGEGIDLLSKNESEFKEIIIPKTIKEFNELDKKYIEYKFNFTTNDTFEIERNKIITQEENISNTLFNKRNTIEKPNKDFLDLFANTILEMSRYRNNLIELCNNELNHLTAKLNNM